MRKKFTAILFRGRRGGGGRIFGRVASFLRPFSLLWNYNCIQCYGYLPFVTTCQVRVKLCLSILEPFDTLNMPPIIFYTRPRSHKFKVILAHGNSNNNIRVKMLKASSSRASRSFSRKSLCSAVMLYCRTFFKVRVEVTLAGYVGQLRWPVTLASYVGQLRWTVPVDISMRRPTQQLVMINYLNNSYENACKV
jgi:hypothetical protein